MKGGTAKRVNAIFNKIDFIVVSYYKYGGKSNGAIVSFL